MKKRIALLLEDPVWKFANSKLVVGVFTGFIASAVIAFSLLAFDNLEKARERAYAEEMRTNRLIGEMRYRVSETIRAIDFANEKLDSQASEAPRVARDLLKQAAIDFNNHAQRVRDLNLFVEFRGVEWQALVNELGSDKLKTDWNLPQRLSSKLSEGSVNRLDGGVVRKDGKESKDMLSACLKNIEERIADEKTANKQRQ